MTTMTATLPNAHTGNARNWDGDKERVSTLTLVGSQDGAIIELAQARFWMARRSDGASPVYCSIWITGCNWHLAGTGRATGGGYHKRSAALQAALDSAGVRLTQAIDGCGDGAMEDAMIAIGVSLGHKAYEMAVLS